MLRFFEWCTFVFFLGLSFFMEFPEARNMARVMLAIVLEAFPFMLIGSLVSGLIEVYVSREKLADFLPKNPVRAVLAAGVAGAFFPVCECAVVPIVRRLLRKGLPLGSAVTYLLAAPIVNPVVIASTLMAFKSYGNLTGGNLAAFDVAACRTVFGYVIACAVGFGVHVFFKNREISPEVFATTEADRKIAAEHHHDLHDGHAHGRAAGGLYRNVCAALLHTSGDFFTTARYVVIASAVAVMLQYSIDAKTLDAIPGGDSGKIVGMMGLAGVMNLCSEADAFVAYSLAQFTSLAPGVAPEKNLPAAVMAFLVLGPMFDLKLLAMYPMIFRKRLAVFLPIAVVALTFLIAGLFFNWMVGG